MSSGRSRKRRHLNCQRRNSIVEIFSEKLFADELFEILVRRGNHAHVYFSRRSLTQRMNLAFL